MTAGLAGDNRSDLRFNPQSALYSIGGYSGSSDRFRIRVRLSGSSAATLRSIQGNADAARANAHIAQWKRVNIEVDRIAQDEHALEAVGVADTALRAAVLALRSARQAHDGGMTERTGATVSALCASIAR